VQPGFATQNEEQDCEMAYTRVTSSTYSMGMRLNGVPQRRWLFVPIPVFRHKTIGVNNFRLTPVAGVLYPNFQSVIDLPLG